MGMLDEESPRGSVTDVPLGKVRNMFPSLHPGSTIIATECHQATCVIKSDIRWGFICNIHGRMSNCGGMFIFEDRSSNKKNHEEMWITS